eukprot:5625398-Amphidinium_carterae.1
MGLYVVLVWKQSCVGDIDLLDKRPLIGSQCCVVQDGWGISLFRFVFVSPILFQSKGAICHLNADK